MSAGVPMTRGTLRGDDLELLRTVAAERTVDIGERLFAAGGPVDRVMVVGSAEVHLRARVQTGRRVMEVVREGGAIADIPMLLDAPMPFDAVVNRTGTVCEMDQDTLKSFLSTSPGVSWRWMRSIAVRLDDDRRRLLALTSSDLRAQVAFVLLDQATSRPGGTLAVDLSHDVLADLLGARRQSVSRAIAELRDEGLIRSAYRETVLIDVEGLQRVATPVLPS
jgi:CRP-like cAMP-binding protein